MSQPSIQRQSILSTIVIFAGFGIGAINLIVLQPRILTTEQWGLTRVITEAAILLGNFATLGTTPVIGKFFPFYKRHLQQKEIDLPAITFSVFAAGVILTLLLLQIFKPQIVHIFGKNNPLFSPYYYTLSLFVLFQGTFIYMELFAWFSGKTILSNTLKELLFRLLTTLCLVLFAWKLVSFDGFMALFGCIYLPAVVIIIYAIRKKHGLPLHFTISKVTRRLGAKMISLGSFVFLTTLSNIGFVVCDTLFLASMYNFSQAGIYAVAQYFSQVLEVPMRSMQTSSVPLISEYWRAKNMQGILSVYRKSCLNLLIAGVGLGGLIVINLHNLERFFPPAYSVMIVPIAILVVSRWINLGTGLNAIIIQLSTYWRFDFASTLIYSVIGIPLNFLLISNFSMKGAAVANIIAMTMYNGLRFAFLWKKFGLQPFTWRNAAVLLGGCVLIAAVYMIPALPNLYVDGVLRSLLFAALFGIAVIYFKLSEEMDWLWQKWSRKLGLRR
ncbi:MAG TPA: lipopolysaccharide biosynthesis protein [Phnomibacter sp.]|nr:lipopolysaccharide biosynthesis protein [Phnomibacter sp.]